MLILKHEYFSLLLINRNIFNLKINEANNKYGDNIKLNSNIINSDNKSKITINTDKLNFSSNGSEILSNLFYQIIILKKSLRITKKKIQK